MGWTPVPGAGRPPKWGEGMAETVKADRALVMPLLPLCLPSLSHHGPLGLRGCRGSWQLLGEVSWHNLTLLSGTTSFPFEEAAAAAAAAAKAAAAPALRVYIFFIKSSGIVNLFFKTQRGKEPCIICKQCIIGYVVQSLLYSGLSCSSPPPAPHTRTLCPTPSIPYRQ